MKILIAGINGYIGTALYFHLKKQGHDVVGFDNGLRDLNVKAVGSQSVVEKKEVPHEDINACDYQSLKNFFKKHNPDTIVWLAEQPSAPFSMSNPVASAFTQHNNVIGTLNCLWAMKEVCPNAHLVKLGTEGEYAADIWDGKHIPEGSRIKVMTTPKDSDMFDRDVDYWEIPTPRYGGSFYHFSKIFDDFNIDYACKIWGLTATNIQQGVVYGHRNGTRLDVDESFGTVINRFVAQAVTETPLTVYGTGGQTRGFINLQNSMEAIELLSENPPEKGEFRVIHQSTEALSIMEIAKKVQKLTGCEIKEIKNPREEKEKNSFTFDTTTLDNLGLKKIGLDEELPRLIKVMKENKYRIIKGVINPVTKWK